jgi:hypothetical protein
LIGVLVDVEVEVIELVDRSRWKWWCDVDEGERKKNGREILLMQ